MRPHCEKFFAVSFDAGIHGIFVGGLAGQGPLLVDSQWRRMAEIAVDEVRDRVALLGGVMDTSSRRVCEKVEVLRGMGYRYFVLTPSYYNVIRSPQEHLRLFGQARDAAGDMEMIAYNIPQRAGAALAVDTICDMARRGWIRCCKESSGDWAYLSELLSRSKDVGLSVFAGDEKTSGQGLLSGACGIVPVLRTTTRKPTCVSMRPARAVIVTRWPGSWPCGYVAGRQLLL